MQAKELAGASVQAPLWVLVLVTLSGTMAMHIFVPALPVAGWAQSLLACSRPSRCM